MARVLRPFPKLHDSVSGRLRSGGVRDGGAYHLMVHDGGHSNSYNPEGMTRASRIFSSEQVLTALNLLHLCPAGRGAIVLHGCLTPCVMFHVLYDMLLFIDY